MRRLFKHLAPVRRDGSAPPLFLVHSILGELTWLPMLAHELDERWPLYGFAAPGLNSDEPFFTSLQAMAAAYLEGVRQLQPQGPYVLGGYSFGGIVAFEMTRQLQQAGERVDALVLIDSFVPHPAMKQRLDDWMREGLFLQVIANQLALQWKAMELLPAGLLAQEKDAATQCVTAAKHLLAHCDVPYSFEVVHTYLDRGMTVMQAHAALLSAYQPSPLAAGVRTLLLHNTLGFIGRNSVLLLPDLPDEDRAPDHGWDTLLPTPPVRAGLKAEHFMIGTPKVMAMVARAMERFLLP